MITAASERIGAEVEKVLEGLQKRLKPEASYFFTDGGERTALYVFEMKDSSQIPAIVEPLFMELGADVDFKPVMNAKDLEKGLRKL